MLAVCLVIHALLAGDPAKAQALPPELVPDAARPGPVVLRGSTWTLETDEVTIHLRQVDDAERLNFIGHVTGLAVDPFGSPYDEPPRFLSYLVHIENRGPESLEFNPVHSWLTTNRKQILYPLGMTDLHSMYHEGGMELPDTYERVGPAVLEQARTIDAGTALSGLLVYRIVDARTRSLQVDIELTRPNGKAVLFAAHYRRPPKNDRPG
jgi:hypothetical protein